MDDDEVAGTRGPGTVWLASFPKSGNTWVRAVISALRDGDHMFSVDHMASGAQPYHVGGAQYAFGVDPRWLDRTELDRLRDSLVSLGADRPAPSTVDAQAGGAQADDTHDVSTQDPDITSPDSQAENTRSEQSVNEVTGNREASDSDSSARTPAPTFRKTHEIYRAGEQGREPFPTRATRAAILIVRDPRSVVCSWAPFFGIDLAKAIKRVGTGTGGTSSPAMSTTEQPWGTWSSHAQSWLDPAVPFPVHIVRYEDLKADAVTTLLPILNAVGLTVEEPELQRAVKRTSFDQLVKDEADSGFREVSPKTEKFFRRGGSQTWHEELSRELVREVESDHAEMMARLGYEVSDVDVRDPVETAVTSTT